MFFFPLLIARCTHCSTPTSISPQESVSPQEARCTLRSGLSRNGRTHRGQEMEYILYILSSVADPTGWVRHSESVSSFHHPPPPPFCFSLPS